MKEPLFSIIVPIYNVEKYIRQCVESALGQSWKDFELILVDDGSPDGCGKIIDDYARADERVRVIHKENGGLVHTRMVGTQAARGKYIMTLDGDDFLLEGCLEELAPYLEKYEADIYCFGLLKSSGEDDGEHEDDLPNFAEGLYDTEEKKKDILSRLIYDSKRPFYTFGMSPSICSRLTKREFYSEWQMKIDQKITVGEDLALTVPMMFNAGSIYVIRKNFYNYRVIPDSMSHSFNPKAADCLKLIVKTFLDVAKIDPGYCRIREQLGAYCTNMIFEHLFFAAKKAESYGEYKSYVEKLDDSVLKCLKGCPTRLDSKRAVYETVLVKRKLWRILWITARIMRRKKK